MTLIKLFKLIGILANGVMINVYLNDSQIIIFMLVNVINTLLLIADIGI